MDKNLKGIEFDLSAFWLIFSNSFSLKHENAPRKQADDRELTLISLLYDHLTLNKNLKHNKWLTNIADLLKIWQDDLKHIYSIRTLDTTGKNYDLAIKTLASKWLKRISELDDYTIIPNGLISAKHTKKHEMVNVAIVKKSSETNRIDWLQINPGCEYHSAYETKSGKKSCAYLHISEINSNVITQDWLELMIGLKTLHPNGYYKTASLYECLLSHLNGKTLFNTDDHNQFTLGYSDTPAHTWQVLKQMLYYLIKDNQQVGYEKIYDQLIINFKLSMLKKLLDHFQASDHSDHAQLCYLLQEASKNIAKLCSTKGNKKQIETAAKLILTVSKHIDEYLISCDLTNSKIHQLEQLKINSIQFEKPNFIDYKIHAEKDKEIITQQPLCSMPSSNDNIINYLEDFIKNNIEKLSINNDYNLITINKSIEALFLDHLSKINLLKNQSKAFSENDTKLAILISNLTECYSNYQSIIINKDTSIALDPMYYSKNLIIQFFSHAMILSLNLNDKIIGPIISDYQFNLCVNDLDWQDIYSHLLIDDPKWFKLMNIISHFFQNIKGKKTLFNKSSYTINDSADRNIEEIKIAYLILQSDEIQLKQFKKEMEDSKGENENQIWAKLLFQSSYLPSLYNHLIKSLYASKAALVNKLSENGWSKLRFNNSSNQYWQTICTVEPINKFPYNKNIFDFFGYQLHNNYIDIGNQALIYTTEKFDENTVVAQQYNKPYGMDRIQFMRLGFIQSEFHLKFARLYIALKQEDLNFCQSTDCLIIRQTLFGLSGFYAINSENKTMTILTKVSQDNPKLLKAFGSLCVKKALDLKLKLSEHSGIAEIIQVSLRLLNFYPNNSKTAFKKEIKQIYDMLYLILKNPSNHLTNTTLLHLNAYLVISAQSIENIDDATTFNILNSLLMIEKYKVAGFELQKNITFELQHATFTLTPLVKNNLINNNQLLNKLMLGIIDDWDSMIQWQLNKESFSFAYKDYLFNPMLGLIYYKNQPICGLPHEIIKHSLFKHYFKNKVFTVIPSEMKFDSKKIACFLSIDLELKTRLALLGEHLIIEEKINGQYQRYIPKEKILNNSHYPNFLLEYQDNNKKLHLTHWLVDKKIFIKDANREVEYEWDIEKNTIYSVRDKNYLAPYQTITKNYFYSFLSRIEKINWIKIITNNENELDKIVLPRLNLSFSCQKNLFNSNQLHGYHIAKQQYLNILANFNHYIILENKATIKLIIPNRTLTLDNQFYDVQVTVLTDKIKTPSYFVYEYDQRTSSLKSTSIASRWYLSLIYFCKARANDYSLVMSQLELCWKMQPYNENELAVIRQFFEASNLKDRHCNRISLLLKVVLLIINSVETQFLNQDKKSKRDFYENKQLLQDNCDNLTILLEQYLKKENDITTDLRLTYNEIKTIVSFLKDECYMHYHHQITLCLENENINSFETKLHKQYNERYLDLFSKKFSIHMASTYNDFFQSRLSELKFSSNINQLDLNGHIKNILVDRLSVTSFLALYSIIINGESSNKFPYLLHHLLVRNQRDYDVARRIARLLLIIYKNISEFYRSDFQIIDRLIKSENFTFYLKDTSLDIKNLLDSRNFGVPYYWSDSAKRDNTENNKKIIELLRKNDLNAQDEPLYLPDNFQNFQLNYEKKAGHIFHKKKTIINYYFLESAKNSAIKKLFFKIVEKCDAILKYTAVFNQVEKVNFKTNTITTINLKPVVTKKTEQTIKFLPLKETGFFQIENYFSSIQLSSNNNFPLEKKSTTNNILENKFYNMLKNSYQSYSGTIKYDYKWIDEKSCNTLLNDLNKQHALYNKNIKFNFNKVKKLFEFDLNSEEEQIFYLQYIGRKFNTPNKSDILRLVLNPKQAVNYHPGLSQQINNFIQLTATYLQYEIYLSKLNRIYDSLYQYQNNNSQLEKKAFLLQTVKLLKEKIDPLSYQNPHWLLFQFENQLIIRKNQKELILAMRHSKEKAMYQLNMGEGKSSVILPLLCYELADGQQIVRVNVLLSLYHTMKNQLSTLFSGLIRKKIYSMPFVRETDDSSNNMNKLIKSMLDCQNNRDILLVTPTDRMCLQLKLRERLINNYHNKELKSLVKLNYIDLLDESDEILKHGTELNYTVGDKIMFDGEYFRWTIPIFFIQLIFTDNNVIEVIKKGMSNGFTYYQESINGNSSIQFIKNDYYLKQIKPILLEKFISHYLETLLEHQITPNVPIFKDHPTSTVNAYLSGNLSNDIEIKFSNLLSSKKTFYNTLLLVKGWLSHDLLFHVFQAKYRVKYGLDSIKKRDNRKIIAVPYYAKDTPSTRSEFSHPDVMIGFTILSYLYHGLNQQELKTTLTIVKNKYSLQVANKYLLEWTKNSNASKVFTSFDNIDLHDEYCLNTIHKFLKNNLMAILFYLREHVFPLQAYQYQFKISANAHSLVGYRPALGFSGTDDRKLTMPFEIKSLRSLSQEGTNGKLIDILSQKRNQQYYCTSAKTSLKLIQNLCQYIHKHLDCYIILDAGALITGLSNHQTADALINYLPNKFLGVVYFDDETNELTVLTRDKTKVKLHDCHIAKHNLFSYLDDIHTRGTDLKLPLHCIGMLTIGLTMEKDKLVQAAMRLRELAKTQSIVFWGNDKVTSNIAFTNKIAKENINTVEIIKWTIHNTLNTINSDLFEVSIRKINFQFNKIIEQLMMVSSEHVETLTEYAKEKELFALKEFYAFSPTIEDLADRLYLYAIEKQQIFWAKLKIEIETKKIKITDEFIRLIDNKSKHQFRQILLSTCQETSLYLTYGKTQLSLNNDQEKLVEVEKIKQKQRMTIIEQATPQTSVLWNTSIIYKNNFIDVAKENNIIVPIKSIENYSKLTNELKSIKWHGTIFMTTLFLHTIKRGYFDTKSIDNYFRLIDVIMIYRHNNTSYCILLSGHEAQKIKLELKANNSSVMLVHLDDINGPTTQPINAEISSEEYKLLTIIKLFSGKTDYPDSNEVRRVAKRIGRILPSHFVTKDKTITQKIAKEIYSELIEQGYLNHAGMMSTQLIDSIKAYHSEEKTMSLLNKDHQQYNKYITNKLVKIYNKLIVDTSSIKNTHSTFWKWVNVRGKSKEYEGSELQTILRY